MVSTTDLTIKSGSNFYFFCIKVFKFQILVRGRFENDPHGRRAGWWTFFFRKNVQNNILGKVTKNVMIKARVKEDM